MNSEFWLPKAAILHPGRGCRLIQSYTLRWGLHHQLLLCTWAAAQPVSHRHIAVPQSHSSFTCDSPCDRELVIFCDDHPSRGVWRQQTTGEDLAFRWAALGGKTLTSTSSSDRKLSNVVSNNVIWEFCLRMLKSCLESREDLIVGPGLQMQDLFPEEHQAISLSILAEVAPFSTCWLC